MRLEIRDLEFGKTDAKNEFANDPAFFVDSFYSPNFSLDDYLEGSKYFIQGAKGSGKTAILNFLHSKNKNNSDFIYYKKEIDSEIKNSFFDLMRIEFSDISNNDIFNLDFENVWTLQLHSLLVEKIQDKNFFKNDGEWKKYLKKIKEVGKEKLLFFENINLLLKARFSKDVSLNASSQLKVREDALHLSKYVKSINSLFLKLTPQRKDSVYYIFIDEVELNKFSENEYIKDITLIRDLVIAINSMNLLSKQKRHQIKWVMAIRSEVLSSVYSSGKEINKILNDFGNKLSWTQTGGNPKDNGLMKILLNKIRASEKKKGISEQQTDSELFDKYFESSINNIEIAQYILQQTFFKPRDIVRLFTEIRSKYGHKSKFTQEVFDGTREDYALNTWDEITELLSIQYTNEELKGIQLLLSGTGRTKFTIEDLEKDIIIKKDRSKNLKQLFKKHDLEDILENLYIAGVIGNFDRSSKTPSIRFHHRGQEQLLINKNMLIHDSVIKIFV